MVTKKVSKWLPIWLPNASKNTKTLDIQGFKWWRRGELNCCLQYVRLIYSLLYYPLKSLCINGHGVLLSLSFPRSIAKCYAIFYDFSLIVLPKFYQDSHPSHISRLVLCFPINSVTLKNEHSSFNLDYLTANEQLSLVILFYDFECLFNSYDTMQIQYSSLKKL